GAGGQAQDSRGGERVRGRETAHGADERGGGRARGGRGGRARGALRRRASRANPVVGGALITLHLFGGEGEAHGTIALVAKAHHSIGGHDDVARSTREGSRFGGLESLYNTDPERC